jgi:hypothetical protein
LKATQSLNGITALAKPGIAGSDVLLYRVVSDVNKPKEILASALKTYVGAVSALRDR